MDIAIDAARHKEKGIPSRWGGLVASKNTTTIPQKTGIAA